MAALLCWRSTLTRGSLPSCYKIELTGTPSCSSLVKWKRKPLVGTTVRGTASGRVNDYNQRDRTPTSMTFEQYRKLSKKIKNVSRLPGIAVGLLSMSASMSIAVYVNPTMFQAPPEEAQLIFGMDPLMVTAFAGLGSGVVSYLLTSMSVAAIWRRSYKELQQWDQNFLNRLDKHRYMEVNKFEDDYYGDKIRTLSDYRQWVRKQHKRRDDLKAHSSSSNPNSSSSTDASSSSTN